MNNPMTAKETLIRVSECAVLISRVCDRCAKGEGLNDIRTNSVSFKAKGHGLNYCPSSPIYARVAELENAS